MREQAQRGPRYCRSQPSSLRPFGASDRAALSVSSTARICPSRNLTGPVNPRPLPEQNHLLNALSDEVRARVFPDLELVTLELGKALYESGDGMRHVYFPVDSIISLLYVMEDGASAEISVVGNEGLVGVSLFMGGESTPSRGVVQSAGSAYRLLGRKIKEEFNRHGELLVLMLRYTLSLIHI